MKQKLVSFLPWAILTVLFGPALYQLYLARWENIDYTHAYFILPVSLWLVWRERTKLIDLYRHQKSSGIVSLFHLTKSNEKTHNNIWLWLLVFGVLVFLFGWRNDYLFITTFSLIPISAGLSGYLYGNAVLKALSFPILYLLFMVPPPLGILDAITLPMRHGASVVTHKLLVLFHYPVERSGLLLYLGGHEIFVGEPCSGFRSLITLLALGSVFIYITEGRVAKKVVLAASIIPLALIGNVVRIITLTLITYYFGEKVGQGFFHYFSGALVFLIALLGLMGLEAFLSKRFENGSK